MRSSFAATLALALTLTPAALADDPIWVVDPSGAGDFVEIAEALPSVFQGGAVLIRPGVYTEPVNVFNHGITLVADGTGPVVLTQTLKIESLGVTRDFVASGLELRGGFEVKDCTGLVRFEDCTVPEPPELGFPADLHYTEFPLCGIGSSSQIVDDSRAVTFVNCEFHGASGMDGQSGAGSDAPPGHHGLWVRDASVALYDCVLRGGDGGSAISPGHYPVTSGAGGDGLRLVGDEAFAHVAGLDAAGGVGGTFVPGGNGDFGVTFGCDGIDVRADDGSVVEASAHPPIAFHAPALWQADVDVDLVVEGPVGSGAFLVVGAQADWRPFPATMGILHILPPYQIHTLGQIPGAGTLTVPVSSPGAADPNQFVSLQLQVFGTELGTRFLSNPRRSLVVDSGL